MARVSSRKPQPIKLFLLLCSFLPASSGRIK
jgi:hypothetical protein